MAFRTARKPVVRDGPPVRASGTYGATQAASLEVRVVDSGDHGAPVRPASEEGPTSQTRSQYYSCRSWFLGQKSAHSQSETGEKAAFSGSFSRKAEPFAAPICHLQL